MPPWMQNGLIVLSTYKAIADFEDWGILGFLLRRVAATSQNLNNAAGA